jgi:hypothetical protein
MIYSEPIVGFHFMNEYDFYYYFKECFFQLVRLSFLHITCMKHFGSS